ncbi:MAG: radical SAM protein [Bacteroidetes bacterium GWE2_39_28]|nr:MAG: radical SAM protein [Bacteroidetes bacterium GWE2_39_28]OFY15148.1 MAG: radical SAM protein [Bacteroidetes bacterium GWF2_39_10]OFZ08322.1 MAG: radical SAM protein [Bacteroidetes bacterium RIFOXYB2_FULL_39_7]OFZ10986.1 MAG: radical SAM protein [Bacteroidetes bacterium RIFOXYC2_FULL_39_11]HCT93768.1 radical SAM protein [Rikenellaceae bacterium]
MSTILFNEIVFGPVKSRRLGVSLGVNLLPRFGKYCNFDCIYCECGFNSDGRSDTKLPEILQVREALLNKIANHDRTLGDIDTITFSGNGEPTMHPSFSEIIDLTLEIRDLYVPKAKVSVLTNGSGLSKPKIKEAIKRVDNAIIKIDSAFDKTVNLIDRPQFPYSVEKVIKDLEDLKGVFVLQTMFLRGEYDGVKIDNTTKEEIEGWYKVVKRINPREIMVYTIDRDTPAKDLQKVTVEEMELIVNPLRNSGFKISVSG